MENAAEMLDKERAAMIEYFRIQYRVERKEYRYPNLRESGSPAESPDGIRCGKVRPGANLCPKVINESGTAAQTASCTECWYKGLFYLVKYYGG